MPTANLCNKLLQGYTTMIICDRLASTLCGDAFAVVLAVNLQLLVDE